MARFQMLMRSPAVGVRRSPAFGVLRACCWCDGKTR